MVNKKYNEELEQWLNDNKDKIIAEWMRLVRIPSIKSEATVDSPFGENCKKALLTAAEIFEKSGFKTKKDENNTYALVFHGNEKNKIGIFSHSDVVPVSEGWIYTKPFEPVIIDGTLIGRGVEDNKSGIIAAYCVFNFLKEKNITLNNGIELFIGSDEECGMVDLQNYLKNEAMPAVSLVPDADFPCSIGEKGIYHLMSESDSAFEGITDIDGGQAYNIVLDKVSVKIPYSKTAFDELSLKSKGNGNFEIDVTDNEILLTVKGVAKHASIPEGSQNAAYLAISLLCECDFLSEHDKGILFAAKELLGCYYGKGLGIEHHDEMFGKTTCVNGICKTVDGRLNLSFDIRYGDSVDPNELEKTIDENLKAKHFKAVHKDNSPGFSIEKESKFPSVFENIYEELTGERLERVTMSGGTYARKLKNAFSIGTSIIKKDREAPVFEMPDGHGGAHQCDECIDIEGFFQAVKVLFNYILACDELLLD